MDMPSVWLRTTEAPRAAAVRKPSSTRNLVGYCTPSTFSSKPSQYRFIPPQRKAEPFTYSRLPVRVTNGEEVGVNGAAAPLAGFGTAAAAGSGRTA